MATVFFSYSHKDEELRDRLETALATMKRQGLIEAWHDRRLKAGDDFDHGVRSELERAEVILLLVSPDFIASDYCHDVEMARALERHERREARVIPVILRACDWKPMPFGKLLAAPSDGKPVRSWPDLDEAFLDVVQKIRAALPSAPNQQRVVATPPPAAAVAILPRSSNLRLKKTFTDADHNRFLDEAFGFIARFFEGSLAELQERNPGIETAFKRIDANRFTAVIYQGGRSTSRCSIMLGNVMGRGIFYSSTDRAESNSFNESLSAANDDQGLFLLPLGIANYGRREAKKLTFEGAAELYWEMLVRPLQEH